MRISDLKIHYDLTFEQYRALPGLSFSQVKHVDQRIIETEKMALGKAVDAYLTRPETFKGDIRIVKPLAQCLRSTIGDLWLHLRHQVAVECTMRSEIGLRIAYKGLIDSGIFGKIVIDYKVGVKVRKSMNFMGYPNQLNGYGISFSAPLRLIIAVDPSERRPMADVIPVHPSVEYWENVCHLHGHVEESVNHLM